MPNIKATATTYLKKQPFQSAQLTANQKLLVPLGKEYQITGYSPSADGHYLVELAHQAGNWYLYSGHWQLPWEDNREQREYQKLSYFQPVAAPTAWQQIDWKDMNSPLSQYFTVREATNADKRRIPTDPAIKQNIFRLAKELDKVRKAWGTPIVVTSWYRPPAINRAVGGVSNSQHILGKAADIKPSHGDLKTFQHWLDTVAWKDKALGFGAKRGFVHVDLRPTPIRWNY